MNDSLYKNLKLENIIIILFPFAIITGPAIRDILAVILGLYFLYNIIKKRNFYYNKDYWIYFFLLIWIWFILISVFAYNSILSFVDSIIFVRFIIFVMAIYYFFQKNDNLTIFVLYSILLASIFVTLDTLFQFYNYDNSLGFRGDIFGILPDNLYGRLNGPFTDFVPGSYLSRFYFFLVLFLLINIKKINTNFLLYCSIIISSLILSTIYFSGERMAVATTLMGILIIAILIKKMRKIILISSIFAILFIVFNQLFHPFYTDYKIIESSGKHEGLVIERKYECSSKDENICKKIFKIQPTIKKIYQDFDSTAYGQTYRTAFEIWKDNKITGIGIGNFEEVCLNESKYKKFNTIFGCGSHPHNYYIQALVETGLPGLIFFISLVLSFFYKFKSFNKNKYNIIGIVILLVLFWPIMSTGSFIKNWNMIFICYLIGIILGIKLKNFKTS